MTEQNLHDYNKWLMEVWNPNQLYIPFAIDAPKAFLDYQAKQLIIADVVDEFYCDIVVGEEGYRCKEQCQMCKDYIDKQQ